METSSSKNKTTLFKLISHFCYTQIAGVSALVFTNFFEVLKVRKIMDSYLCNPHHFQAKTNFRFLPQFMRVSPTASAQLASSGANCSGCLPQGNLLYLYKYLIRTEGLRRVLFGGISTSMMSHLLRVGIFFPLREELLKKFKSSKFAFLKEYESFSSILSSGLARTVTTIVAFPFDIKKIDSQLNQKFEKNAKKMKLSQFRIYIPALLQFYQKEMFNTLFFWIVFEIFKKYFSQDKTRSETEINIRSATAAGGFSAFMSHPNDYFQTVTNSIRRQNLDKAKVMGSWQVIQHYRQKSILPHIASGITLRTSRGFMINAIFFGIFETMKSRKQDL